MPAQQQIAVTVDNALYLVKRYGKDPEGFLRDVLLIRHLDDWQRRVCSLLAQGVRRIAVASCNGSGKSFLTSALEVWWIITHPDATVSACSATRSQLLDVHMREIRSHIDRSIVKEWFDTSSTQRICLANSGDKAFISAVSNNQTRPEAIQGRHHGSLLTIFDEASGIYPDIYTAQEGNMTTPGATWLVIGNPTATGTPFHDIFRRTDNVWVTMHLDARDCCFTDKTWVQQMITAYGAEDDRVRARVFGEFPRGALQSCVAEEDYDNACKRWTENFASEDWYPDNIYKNFGSAVIIGLDVAKGVGRDSSVLCARCGSTIIEMKEIPRHDVPSLAAETFNMWKKYKAKKICIDYTGGWGQGPGDILKGQVPPGTVVPVEFGGASSDPKRWKNKRAELWLKLGDWMKGATLPPKFHLGDGRLRKDILDVEWWLTPKDQVQVESKDDLRLKKGESPDWGDSLICSLAVDIYVQPEGIGTRQEVSRNAWKNLRRRAGGLV